MPRLNKKKTTTFGLSLTFQSSTYTEEFTDYNHNSTVGSVKSRVKTVINELRSKTFTLSYNGVDLINDNDKLINCITTTRAHVTLLVDVSQIGGTQISNKERTSWPDEILGSCERKTCVVFQSTMLCIQMDCGCWFSFDGLRGEVKRQHSLNKYHKLQCCICQEEWKEVSDTIWICGFNTNDTRIFEKEFCKRKQGVSCVECPSCHNVGKRKLDVKIHRLACGMCGVNFCLHCEKKWTGSGMVLCGNTNCVNYDIQDQLDNCRLLTKDTNKDNEGHYYRWIEWCGENIPVLRACPKCLCIIRFKDKCQHMTCPKCTHEFCYICLGDWKNSNGDTIHSYVSETNQCKTAGRQKFR